MSDRCCGPNGGESLKPATRREFLSRSGFGFGMLALASLLAQEGLLAAEVPAAAGDPLAPKKPHFDAKAKSVIFLFMSGGPS
ncbi:MAG TPA: hypothetical protein VFU47_04625, partial [Armatimonadota bacterium]|nr:hypothetical protein [Armatimonadota bacterium]